MFHGYLFDLPIQVYRIVRRQKSRTAKSSVYRTDRTTNGIHMTLHFRFPEFINLDRRHILLNTYYVVKISDEVKTLTSISNSYSCVQIMPLDPLVPRILLHVQYNPCVIQCSEQVSTDHRPGESVHHILDS